MWYRDEKSNIQRLRLVILRKAAGDPIKNLANVITIIRIIGAGLMVFTVPLTVPFWILYACCGVSDILDGLIARALKQESEMGAKLDSIADIIFGFAMIIVFVPIVSFPLWIWIWIAAIVVIRMTTYVIGYKKYHTLTSLHTYANKLTGLLLFTVPVLLMLLGVNITGILLCIPALLSAVEELAIIAVSNKLDRNCKGLLTLDFWRRF